MMNFEFNTGRGYSDKGQVIEVKTSCIWPDEFFGFGSACDIFFYDKSRDIYGKVDNATIPDDASQADIERAVISYYDNGRYESITPSEYETFNEITTETGFANIADFNNL